MNKLSIELLKIYLLNKSMYSMFVVSVQTIMYLKCIGLQQIIRNYNYNYQVDLVNEMQC